MRKTFKNRTQKKFNNRVKRRILKYTCATATVLFILEIISTLGLADMGLISTTRELIQIGISVVGVGLFGYLTALISACISRVEQPTACKNYRG